MKIALFITALAALVCAEMRPVVAILELTGNGVDTTETRSLTNRLRAELFETGKYTIVERSEMDAIFKEHGFQHTGCTSISCAVEAGQLLNTQFIIVGTIDRVGRLYSINIRMINVKSDEIINSAKTDCNDCKIEDVMLKHIHKVSRIIAGIESDSKNGVITEQRESNRLVYKDYKGGEAGTIVIEASPEAEISLDGKPYGKGSMTIDSITVGQHKLVAQHQRNRPIVKKIKILSNSTKQVDFTNWFHFCIESGMEIVVPPMKAYDYDEQTYWFASSPSIAFSWRDKNNSIQFGMSGAIVKFNTYYTQTIDGNDVRFDKERFAANFKFGYYRSLWNIDDMFKGELGLQTGFMLAHYGIRQFGVDDNHNYDGGFYFGGPGFNILAGKKSIFLKMSYLGWFGCDMRTIDGTEDDYELVALFKNTLGLSLLFRM